MKKFVLSAIVAVALLSSFAAAPERSKATAAREAAALVLDKAVREGVISERQKSRFLESGIIEETAQTLVSTDFDVAAAVDKGTEKAVEKGYFKSKKQAKHALRQTMEQARKSEDLWQKVYRMMGI